MVTTDLAESLILEHIPFAKAYAYGIIKRWPRYEWEDAFGDAMVGLVKAAITYDPESGYAFTTYSSHRIRSEVLSGIRSRNGHRKQVAGKYTFVSDKPMSLHALGSSYPDDDVLHSKEDYQSILGVEDNHDDLEDASFRRNLEQVINRFGDRDKMIYTLYYFEGIPMWQIGDLYDMTESRVCQILKALNRRLWYVLKEAA